MTVTFMDFPGRGVSDHMPEKSNSIAHNGKQDLLVYRTGLGPAWVQKQSSRPDTVQDSISLFWGIKQGVLNAARDSTF